MRHLATAFAVASAVSPVAALGPPPAAAQNPIEEILKDLINDVLSPLEDPVCDVSGGLVCPTHAVNYRIGLLR